MRNFREERVCHSNRIISNKEIQRNCLSVIRRNYLRGQTPFRKTPFRKTTRAWIAKMFALMQPRDRFQDIVKSSDVLFWKRGQTPFSKPIPYCNPGILNLSTTSPVSRSTSIAFFVSLSTMSFPVAIWKRAFKKVIP